MVSQYSLAAMVFSLILSVIVPVALIVYLRRKVHLSLKPVFIGILTWFVFSQILEKLLHVYVLTLNPYTVNLMKNAFFYALYGGLAAGIFEEVGRFVMMKFMMKRHHQWKDGIAFGLGHGTIEALLVGGMTTIISLVLAITLNSGSLPPANPAVPSEVLTQLTDQLTRTTPFVFAITGIERLLALTAHVFFSLVVLYGVVLKKARYLLYAILAHALMDFIPALYQKQVLSIWVTELWILVCVAFAFILIFRFRKLFDTRAAEYNTT